MLFPLHPRIFVLGCGFESLTQVRTEYNGTEADAAIIPCQGNALRNANPSSRVHRKNGSFLATAGRLNVSRPKSDNRRHGEHSGAGDGADEVGVRRPRRRHQVAAHGLGDHLHHLHRLPAERPHATGTALQIPASVPNHCTRLSVLFLG